MKISVALLTRNRPAEFARCIQSISLLETLIQEVLILDNAGDLPLPPIPDLKVPVRVTRVEKSLTCLAGRNALASLATGDCLFILDDDAYVMNADALVAGAKILDADRSVGAVAFTQCDEAGNLPPGFGQSAPVDYLCETCGFAGYAALLRLDVFKRLGGFRELLIGYGEEQEYCKRLWDIGCRVVFTPERSFAHLPSQTGRDFRRVAVLTLRNHWITAALLEPACWFVVTLPLRLRRLLRYSSYSGKSLGERPTRLFAESIKSALTEWRAIWSQRTPLRYRTIWRWEKLKRTYPRYGSPGDATFGG